MCGIAGIIDLAGQQPITMDRLSAMATAIIHRGPDEDGFFQEPGLGFASRRLSIVGLADGRQPITNEDGSVVVVFNGELFDYPEQRAMLEGKGHKFVTHTDTELIPHMWEEYGEQMFEHLHGQFAICLYDRKQRCVILARDRIGICPLFYSIQRGPGGEEKFIFGSEIKALLASGLVPAKADVAGLMHVFTFVAAPGPATAFAGVTAMIPGRYIRIDLDRSSNKVSDQRPYWQLSFPDWGSEESANESEDRLVDRFEEVLLGAVSRRLRADVPVVSYLSGGVDSSLVVALACKVLGRPIPTFTIGVKAKGLNEEAEAGIVAKHLNATPVIVPCGDAEVRDTYPEMIEAGEGPVIDTACAAMVLLAKSVRAHGFKVALTGEGADEWLAGYPWFKIHKLLGFLDVIPGVNISLGLRQLVLSLIGQPKFSKDLLKRARNAVGGHNAWLDLYGMMSVSKLRFFAPEHQAIATQRAFVDELQVNPAISRWHPFHRSLYMGGRVHLPGLLLGPKGDRPALHSSVETRYPFLDEQVIQFLANLHPKWKLPGFQDKYLLRKLALRWLPKSIALRKKLMFRAPMDSFHLTPAQGQTKAGWIEQVLSRESLKKTGYFDADAVAYWREKLPSMPRMLKRTTIEMGLVGVTATQLWHHLFISGDLAEIPSWIRSSAAGMANRGS
ncbi:asparagine synthase (glutamine-hydrolyzing) [Tuwongella immobilis]|uniref:asparagine synthase (glutamine-hydrolyzing) n=1 Tax=Tuwongella immobilis TaxID=692036 RepID=A0A6C2YX94_9BACT|nr:asparagine synthase (glutamine-hydrolyzing) [Tuwongella immobilis]VIP05442.1 asparagine synthase : Uncultured bacterium genome assembly Metasoil_fosmids_resub OS=uncultured bacterium PE=4 SV=1: GATase_7: Asn_synthase [Tuwongella immobilis]VTS08240.1 asparagine synthase : Uncultured bacterium genome assembly Metasoil_fosmids_resub OS=uncultured bacterium PE=4 SV=1: GATase_7: Asn_synthase [Tuwongella immobilis]